jgi:hypothetical protein
MSDRNSCDEIEFLMERLVHVENALFYLKLRSDCLSSGDAGEEERLEKQRRELHQSYERLEKREMGTTST